MYFFQKCIGDRLVDATVSGSNAVKAYASTYTSGQGSVALVNVSASARMDRDPLPLPVGLLIMRP